jgi:hypothetical protein
VPGLLLAALLATAFHGALGGRLFYLRDISQNHMPGRRLVTERMLAGKVPLWDPFHGGGTPLLANPNQLVLHPISILFLLLPFEAAFTASILLQFALLALGGYLLARALPVARAPAVLCAGMLALSGPAASLASLQNVLAAFAFVPIALWAWLRMIEDGRRRYTLIATLAASIVLMTGEVASLAAILVFAPLLAWARPPRPAAERDVARRGAGVAVAGAAALLVAALLASIQWVPAMELVGLSPRGGGLPLAEATKWPLRPVRLFELILPRLFGDPTHLSPEAWWGRWIFEGGYPFLLSAYVGMAPALLVVTALGAGRERRRALGLAAGVAGFVILALAGGGIAWLPGARMVRYPERFLLGALVGLALLAALGLDRMLRMRAAARVTPLLLAGAATLFVAATLVAAQPTIVDGALQRLGRIPASLLTTEAGAVVRGGLLRSLLWALAEALMLLIGAAIIERARPRLSAAGAWVIAFAASLSMVIAAAPARSTAAPGWLRDPSPLQGLAGHGSDAPRVHHAPRPAALSVWATTDEQIWGYRFDRFTYALLTGHPDRVPTVLDAATDRMDLAGQAALGAGLEAMPIEQQVRILKICHAGLLLSFDELTDPGLEPLTVLEGLSRPPLRAYGVRNLPPRARFVSRARGPAWPADAARSLTDRGFDPENEVLIDGVREPPPPTEGTPATVRVLQDDPERVRIGVEADHPGFLVLADSYAPGWKARVDGREAPLLRGNFLFRAVAVDQGKHRVEMIYRPHSLMAGAALTAAGLLLLAFWMTRRSVALS